MIGVRRIARACVTLICVLAIPCVSPSQSKRSAWENLDSLRPGQKIQVVDSNSARHSGTFSGVSDDAIRLQSANGEETIQRVSVKRVVLRDNGHRTRNALIGAAIGAGAGAAIGPIGHHQGSSQNPNGTLIKPGQAAAAGTVIGGVLGGVVGALLPSRSPLYQASSH